MVLPPVPVEDALPETGPGRENGDVAAADGAGLRIQRSETVRPDVEHPVGGGLHVVDQRDVRGAADLDEIGRVDAPRQIGRPTDAGEHGAGHAEAGRLDPRRRAGGQERGHDLLQRAVLAAREALLAYEIEAARARLEQSQQRLRAADVAREDRWHRVAHQRCRSPSYAGDPVTVESSPEDRP